jgi:hypothetical protein
LQSPRFIAANTAPFQLQQQPQGNHRLIDVATASGVVQSIDNRD